MEKNTGPLVSVVLPTYGRPEMLLDAVKSVIHQTYSSLELLVIDDHSPVPAKETLESVSTTQFRTIRIIRHDENKGANVARNTGIKNASGDFIAFLDDDDRWDPTKIERQVAIFKKVDDTVGVVYTGQRFVNDQGNTTSFHVSEIEGTVTKQLLCGARVAPFSSVMVRSEIIPQAGLPDERFPCWQDREWYVRLSRHCEFKPIPEPLVVRRIGDYDQIGDDYIQKRDRAYPLFLKKHQSLAEEYGQLCRQKMEASLMKKVGKHALRQERYHESRKFLVRSAAHYPFVLDLYIYLLISLSGNRGYKVAKKCKRQYERFSSTI